MGNETWVHHSKRESKQQSLEWGHMTSTRKKVCKSALSSVHTTETIIRYGWAVLLHPSRTPDPTLSVSPVWSFEGWPGMTALCRLWGTAEPCVPGAAGEGVQHLLGWTRVPCSKVEEGWWQRCRLYWICYAFDSVVVQLHKIVTCVTCKWHEIKKKVVLSV